MRHSMISTKLRLCSERGRSSVLQLGGAGNSQCLSNSWFTVDYQAAAGLTDDAAASAIRVALELSDGDHKVASSQVNSASSTDQNSR
jgi:hypothetical protein